MRRRRRPIPRSRRVRGRRTDPFIPFRGASPSPVPGFSAGLAVCAGLAVVIGVTRRHPGSSQPVAVPFSPVFSCLPSSSVDSYGFTRHPGGRSPPVSGSVGVNGCRRPRKARTVRFVPFFARSAEAVRWWGSPILRPQNITQSHSTGRSGGNTRTARPWSAPPRHSGLEVVVRTLFGASPSLGLAGMWRCSYAS